MIQSFQCPACGNFNAIGEPACAKCGQFFRYNCPVCGNPIDNRYLRCGACNTLFNWSKPIQQNAEMTAINTQRARLMYPDSQQTPVVAKEIKDINENSETSETSETRETRETKERSPSTNVPLTSRPVFWLILMISCAVLIAILLFIARIAGI